VGAGENEEASEGTEEEAKEERGWIERDTGGEWRNRVWESIRSDDTRGMENPLPVTLPGQLFGRWHGGTCVL
jgi:hypothetical protein